MYKIKIWSKENDKKICRKFKSLIVVTLRKNCLLSEFFCSVFSRIRTEYGKTRGISPYSVRMRENKDQKKTANTRTFHAVWTIPKKHEIHKI